MILDDRTKYWWGDIIAKWEDLLKRKFPAFDTRNTPFEDANGPTLIIPFFDAEKRPKSIKISKEEIIGYPGGPDDLLERKMRAA